MATQEVAQLQEQKRQLLESASGVSGVRYDDVKSKGVATDDQIPNALARIDNLMDQLNAAIDAQRDQEVQATQAINKIKKPVERMVLRERYLLGAAYRNGLMPWEEVARRMHYSRVWVLQEHTAALLDLYDVLPQEAREVPKAI